MAQVKNLAIKLQAGTVNTYYATWEFDTGGGTSATSTAIKAGALVSISSDATYYNGSHMPDWVKNDRWYVIQVKGDRAVLGKNVSGKHNIKSPVNTKYLSTNGSAPVEPSVDADTLEHYEVKWTYCTPDGVWFSAGSVSTTKETKETYSPPTNAIKFKVSVKPVSKTETVKTKDGETDKPYWTGTAVTAEYTLSSISATNPGAPSVEIEKYKLTASIDNVNDALMDKIQFQVYNGTTKVNTGTATVLACRATYTCDVTAGGSYRVRCRAVTLYGDSEVYSEWSDFSSEEYTIPASVTDVICGADSETSVKVEWTASSTATSYDVEYATKEEYFDRSTQVSSVPVEQSTAYVTGLETGTKWFFRVRAKNDKGNSGWSDIVSTVIGTTPEAPTTWSLTTTSIVGEEVTLYWTHNSEDGSKMTEAQIQFDIDGSVDTVTVPGVSDDEEEPIYSYTFNPSEYAEGAEILWKVRTKGIVSTYSDWSTQRTIKLFAPPTVTLSLSTNEDEVLTTYPFDITMKPGPNTQKPMSYHVSITSKATYESVDAVGSTVMVLEGTELYSKVFNISDREFKLSLSAGDIMLENGQAYNLSVVVAMDSGLTAETTETFTVSWDDYAYVPNAAISIDYNNLSAYITPFCENSEGVLVDDVLLSVYRREVNGTFTEIATGIRNTGVDTVTDPHPSLDQARYRIVAQHVATGGIGYEDLPGQPIGETAIVIQWDEKWVNYDYVNTDAPETAPWVGSLLRFPYNVDTTESYDPDVALIKYIGREHPVSYFGTQRGEGGSWSAVIDKSDETTLYGLRRLAAWRGNVYVREPSGVGYWAKIGVSFPKKHLELTISVTFDITRVEGDV